MSLAMRAGRRHPGRSRPRRPRLPVRALFLPRALLLLLPLLALAVSACDPDALRPWTDDELRTLEGLSLAALPALPPDPSNAVADDEAAARLGHALFFDAGLAADGQTSCASCHQPERLFTDGLPRGEGIGTARRHTPSLVGIAYSPWQYWDGRRDSPWAQALVPLETPEEMGASRVEVLRRVGEAHAEAYEDIFGPLPPLEERDRFPARAGPIEGDAEASAAWEGMAEADRAAVDRAFANVGKSLAAYERMLLPGPSRFDAYVAALLAEDDAAARAALTPEEERGLALFIGEAHCTDCHNGPRLSNDEFHNIGLPQRPGETLQDADLGRLDGVQEALADPFNCLGPHSDASPEDCAELRFVRTEGAVLPAAFKVPSLRGVARTAPYMHDGRFEGLPQVLAHYNAAPLPVLGHSDLTPLLLRPHELERLEAFLRTLDGGLDADPAWLAPPP